LIKQTYLNHFDTQYFVDITNRLNTRPRKLLNFKTPLPVFLNNFKEATLLTINGTSIDDTNYIQEEFFKILKNEYGPAEEVLRNYFRQYLGINLFQDQEDDGEDY